ncbi:ATP-binding protein [Brevundimonas sp. 2R-24]|uniref:histidine kinase n=1 Tax=Peiella sedimenti TaxID=3061083 RepID=A0ABT8SM99_9CAUL|nr:ATP-binding protein [Caulobacteraceae bacterium XZ-24]
MAIQTELRLAELQHRLLGSLELLHAIIAIRLRSVSDPESRRHLAWLTDVVAALVLLNRRLGKDDPLPFDDYLAEAVGFWRRACEGRGVGFVLDTRGAQVGEAHAAALALVLHELVSNAVEHAFKGRNGGEVRITLRGEGENLSLFVADDGAGFGDPAASKEGLNLARGIVEHLGGVLQIDSRRGAGATVTVALGQASTGKAH